MVVRIVSCLFCLSLACAAMAPGVADEPAAKASGADAWIRLLDVVGQRLIAIRPGYDTTRITEPRADDGYVDYAAALNRLASQGVNRKNNAACLLWRVVDREETRFPQSYFESRWFRMVAPPADEATRRFDSYESYGRRKFKSMGQSITGERWDQLFIHFNTALEQGIWKAEEFPLIAEWLNAMDEPLAIIAEAARRPRYFSPVHRGLINEKGEPTFPGAISPVGSGSIWFEDPLHAIRRSLPAFRLRAALLIGRGDGKKAWEDIATCHRLARLWAQSPIMRMYAVGCEAEITANKAMFLLASSGILSDKELLDVLRQRRRMGSWKLPISQLDLGTRFLTLDLTQEVPRRRRKPFAYFVGTGRGLDPAPTPAGMAYTEATLLWATDWNLVAKIINNQFDEWVRVLRIQDDAERIARLTALAEDYWKWQAAMQDSKLRSIMEWLPGRSPQPLAFLLTQRLMSSHNIARLALGAGGGPPFSGAFETSYRQVAVYIGLGDLSIAIAIHKARHGEYPRSLDTLAPRVLKRIPMDLLGQTTYRYRQTPEGCVVYSVGPNRTDNNGQFADIIDDPRNLDDIAVRFGRNSER